MGWSFHTSKAESGCLLDLFCSPVPTFTSICLLYDVCFSTSLYQICSSLPKHSNYVKFSTFNWDSFLSDPGIIGVRYMGLSVSNRPFADLTDVTLADENTNLILTDNVNRAIQGNEAMQVCNYWKGRLLVTKFAANSKGAR